MLICRDVEVAYGSTVALRLESFSARGGETIAVMGPNGSGKTTMLKAIAGLEKPTRGTIETAERVGYVAQHQHQHRWIPLTVRDVITMGRLRDRGLLGRLTRSDRTIVRVSAERLEVDDLLDAPFATLSGGQCQRVLIASALASEPSCLLLDEPITGLDLPSQQTILRVIDEQRAAGSLVMITTHHLAEAQTCTRVVLLAGQVVADASPAEALTEQNLLAAFGPRLTSIPRAGARGSTLVLDDDHGHDHSHRGPSAG